MAKASTIHVRQLHTRDFPFIRDLAAQRPNFTIPAPYVLWLLMHIKGDICLVAEEKRKGQIAYLLAVPVEGRRRSIYVWQLASAVSQTRENAVLPMLRKLRDITEEAKVECIFFSALPRSAEFRRIRAYIRTVWSTKPKATKALQHAIAPGETEYRIDLH